MSTETLADALPKEIERVRDVIKVYRSIPTGTIAAIWMERDLEEANTAITSGDTASMVRMLNKLRGWKL